MHRMIIDKHREYLHIFQKGNEQAINIFFLFNFILKKWGVIVYLEKSLSPITRILKINKDISFSLLIGVLLGISYGGALLYPFLT
jgi:hypothetical protein